MTDAKKQAAAKTPSGTSTKADPVISGTQAQEGAVEQVEGGEGSNALPADTGNADTENATTDGTTVDGTTVEGATTESATTAGADDTAGAADATSPTEDAAGTGSESGLRILLAEDEALIRMDLAEMLAEAGHQIVGQAADGEQAVAMVKEINPDLVVMDIKMPGMDGISAAEQIGKEGLAPVVMLTAFSDKNLVERARDAGVMSYVVKPFSAADVLPAIDIARARWAERKALETEVADLGERFETRKRVDRAKGLLMTQLKLSEADAFRWIQKAAMDRRLSMREVADAVIAGMPAKK